MADIDYASEIEKIKEGDPGKAVNGYISKLVNEAVSKSQTKSYNKGFWHGFWAGLIAVAIIWMIFSLG